MCGIAGFINTAGKNLPTLPITDSLRDLMYMNRLRGVDALGAFKVRQNLDDDFIKAVGDPYNLFQKDNEIKKFFQWSGDNLFFVAHNRHGTKGEKNEVSHAHPFSCTKGNNKDKIILVHNGTIHHIKKEKEFPGVTDSHQICKMIASGMSMTELENRLFGSFALVWYDTEDKTLNFVRNKERPFGFVYAKDSIWFGSELYMVGTALDRHYMKVEKFERLPILQHWIYHHEDKEFEKKTFQIETSKTISDYGSGKPWFTAEEKKEERDLMVLNNKELPKSTYGGSPKVRAWNDFSGSVSTIPTGKNKRFHQTKEKWTQVNDFDGYRKGDSVVFSLSDFRATERNAQTILEGNMVIYSKEQAKLSKIKITGMVGLPIDYVNKSEHLWLGMVTQAYQGPDDLGKLTVKDITECKNDGIDPFRSFPLKGEVTKELVENKESKSSEDSSKRIIDTYQCTDCEKFFTTPASHRIKGKEYGVTVKLCIVCFNHIIGDEDHLIHLFKREKAKQMPVVIVQQHSEFNTVH